MLVEKPQVREFSASELVHELGNALLRVIGGLERSVSHPAPLQRAEEGALTFCTSVDAAAASLLRVTRASIVLCADGDYLARVGSLGATLLVVDAPRLRFIQLVQHFFAPPPLSGVHPTAVVESTAQLDGDVYVGPFTYVGANCIVGAGSVIHGHVYLYPKTRVGRNVIIHAGTVIGADGFGYQRNAEGAFEKFPHLGGVMIEDDVEIGANTCVDRGTLADTIIRRGAKIDNLVHIAHNVVVGRDAAVIAHAMIGGSTRIGAEAWIAPSACLRDGLTIGDKSVVGLASLVVKNVPDGATVMGAPARDADSQRAILAALSKLADSR